MLQTANVAGRRSTNVSYPTSKSSPATKLTACIAGATVVTSRCSAPASSSDLSCPAGLISDIEDERVRHALATNLSDLLRYQNLLCRYDTWALKSLDIFSVHGFPSASSSANQTFSASSIGNGSNVGSGRMDQHH